MHRLATDWFFKFFRNKKKRVDYLLLVLLSYKSCQNTFYESKKCITSFAVCSGDSIIGKAPIPSYVFDFAFGISLEKSLCTVKLPNWINVGVLISKILSYRDFNGFFANIFNDFRFPLQINRSCAKATWKDNLCGVHMVQKW